jgi:hemerythrin superfamily protein
MATAKSGAKPGDESKTDAIESLTTDHKRVKALFKEFSALKAKSGDTDDEKADLVQRICRELKIHTAIEEEVFYPAVREQIDDADLMDEALVEHAGAKELIEQLETMDPDDDLYDAKVTVLGEQIDHHVKEEEGEMFPKAKKTKVDTGALGAEMARRKSELEDSLDEDDMTNGGPKSASRTSPLNRPRS